jgi:type II secretory pathway predicted ATPase ExeA/cell division septation protein DedD
MYNSFFGFSESPFENNLDQRFLFLGTDHEEVLSGLLYFIETNKAFAIVCGDVGTGKSMLLDSLLEVLPENVRPVIISHPQVDSLDLLLSLADTLGIRRTAGASVLGLTEKIKKALIKANSLGKHLLLIIDEAHFLADQALDEIRLLSNIETPDQKLLQILLVGQYELSHKLDRPEMRALRQRININRFLSPLNFAETILYIDHRLQQVGSSFAAVFEDNCRGPIFKMTKGVPRLINRLCDNALLISMAAGLRKVNRKTLKKAEAAIQTDRIFTPQAVTGKADSRWGKYANLLVTLETAVIIVLLGIILLPNMVWFKKLAKLAPIAPIHQVAAPPSEVAQLTLKPSEVKKAPTSKPDNAPVQSKAIEVPPSSSVNQPEPEAEAKTVEAPEGGAAAAETSAIPPPEPQAVPEVEKPTPKAPPGGNAVQAGSSPVEKPPPEPPDFTQVLMKKGEYLTRIASQQYPGSPRLGLVAIILQNPNITNENNIPSGVELILPKIGSESQAIQLKDHLFYALYGRFSSRKSADRVTAWFKSKNIKFLVRKTQGRAGDLTLRIFLGGYETEGELQNVLASLNPKSQDKSPR